MGVGDPKCKADTASCVGLSDGLRGATLPLAYFSTNFSEDLNGWGMTFSRHNPHS